MRSSHSLTLVALILAGLVPAGAGAARAAAPSGPARPAAIVAYHDSGDWTRDTDRVVARARPQLDASTGRKRPALVLDVDDTSLSNYDCLKARDFARASRSSCAARPDLPAIPQTLALYRAARARHVAVFFVTGRRRSDRGATSTNLRHAGYTRGWRLIMRPNRERRGAHDGFKARERRRIERSGFRIVANVGDQRSDLDGGFALRAFKLPNPMYVIPTA
jgi:hypothetical protein